MPRGWTDDDPAKGTPHRRVREQVGLLLGDTGYGSQDGELLRTVILKLAEKRPEEVRDALAEALDD